jgi:3'-phosphoadenosine 5'-phosphosulfate sulfotransferase (PAPS reductase)/FAD synthetase
MTKPRPSDRALLASLPEPVPVSARSSREHPAQAELFPVERPSTAEIIATALAHNPVAIFAMFSGGDGSLAATHLAMNNVPGCEVLHINTGIGIERTRQFVRETCDREGWPLTEVRAKEDCGQDYDQIVEEYGFPGPASHSLMYRRLKERCVEYVVRQRKTGRFDKVMLLTGICHDDSQRRSGYGGREVTHKGAQLWVNHLYWAGASWFWRYLLDNDIPRNPVAEALGMSGECGCGAFANPGELRIWRSVCPKFGARIDRLQQRARELGVHHNWETRPPRDRDLATPDFFSPMCVNCLKSQERVAA